MDQSTQTPSADQAGGQSQPPQQQQTPTPEEQAAMQRGDIPMNVTNSIQAREQADSEAMVKMHDVTSAAKINEATTEMDVKGKEVKEGGAAVDSGAAETTAEDTEGITQGATDHGKSQDQVRLLGEKVEKCKGMPEPFRKILLERVARLAMIRTSAGFLSSTYIIEYEATERYINWAVDVPWVSETEDVFDLAKAKEVMDKSHYGLEPLKERVLEYIASVMLNIKNNGGKDNVIKAPILCVVGLAGTGKTTFAKSMADALGRKFQRIPFGGMADSRVLRGQSRFFPDAEPGAIIKNVVQAGSRNPVILLDEMDRVTETARADIMGVLIEVLDPEQNATFTDHYLDFPFSLQNCLFIATANNVSGIATAVMDRLELIHMPSYNDEEKIYIGKHHVLPKTMKLTGLLPEQLIIDEAVWGPLVRPLGYDPGVRGLDRLITNMCRKAAMIIVTGQAETIKITPENVKGFLPMW